MLPTCLDEHSYHFRVLDANRLEKLAYAPDPPFTRAGSSGVSSMPLHGLDGSVLSITCAEDGVLTALHRYTSFLITPPKLPTHPVITLNKASW